MRLDAVSRNTHPQGPFFTGPDPVLRGLGDNDFMYNDSYWMKRAVEVSKDSKSNFYVGVIVLAPLGSVAT